MNFNQKLYQLLTEMQVIDQTSLDLAFTKSTEKKKDFVELLFKEGLITDVDLGRVIADLFKVPFVDLKQEHIDDDVLRLVPQRVAKRQNVIAFEKTATELKLAMNNPGNMQLRENLEKKMNLPIKAYYATEADIKRTLN